MSSNLMMMLLVVGVLAVGVAKRCDWLGICDTTYNYPYEEEKQKEERKKKNEPEPKEEEKPGLGNLEAVQKSIAISQIPLAKQGDSTVKATNAENANKGAAQSCHFSPACHALVRIWLGKGADPCIPCGSTAKYARSRFSRISYW